MALTKEQIEKAAMNLDPGEREALAEALLRSIDECDADEIDRAWLAEAHRRDAEYQSHQSVAKPVTEVLDRFFNKGSA